MQGDMTVLTTAEFKRDTQEELAGIPQEQRKKRKV